MSAPLVVNTRDGVCWTRRTVTSGGIALYAPESVRTCPDFVMATEAELAEHGIVGSAYALPMPVSPQMPPFPPAPQSYEEKLEREVARLQGLLGEKTTEVHRARRERDLMRERVSEPFGCAHCGTAKRVHGRRYISGVGMHGWERPSDEQVRERMLARRAASMPMPSVPELDKAHDDLMGANLSLFEEEQENARLRLALESARRGRRELRARVAELEAQAAQLAPLREAALHDLPPGTQWRVIATDSESLTGLAPVCTADRRLHEIPDYPGGPKYDDEGVYDCCPWPQVETYSVAVAAYLVALLNADAAKGGDAR